MPEPNTKTPHFLAQLAADDPEFAPFVQALLSVESAPVVVLERTLEAAGLISKDPDNADAN